MRLQLALNVNDLDDAIAFYSKMFDAPPAKVKAGCANFAIENPPLKLVLFQATDGTTTTDFHHLNHLGVETESAEEVVAAEARLTHTGIGTSGLDDTLCCYAEKTETWVESPDGAKWEWYVKTGDSDVLDNTIVEASATARCC